MKEKEQPMTSVQIPTEVTEYFRQFGRIGGMAANQKKKARSMRKYWATVSEEERKEHMKRATAASLEARRKRREQREREAE